MESHSKDELLMRFLACLERSCSFMHGLSRLVPSRSRTVHVGTMLRARKITLKKMKPSFPNFFLVFSCAASMAHPSPLTRVLQLFQCQKFSIRNGLTQHYTRLAQHHLPTTRPRSASVHLVTFGGGATLFDHFCSNFGLGLEHTLHFHLVCFFSDLRH